MAGEMSGQGERQTGATDVAPRIADMREPGRYVVQVERCAKCRGEGGSCQQWDKILCSACDGTGRLVRYYDAYPSATDRIVLADLLRRAAQAMDNAADEVEFIHIDQELRAMAAELRAAAGEA